MRTPRVLASFVAAHLAVGCTNGDISSGTTDIDSATFEDSASSIDAALGPDAPAAPDTMAMMPVDSGVAVMEVAPETPVDPCVGRIVCDDFEKDSAGAKPGAPFNVSTNKGSAVVDETRAFSGKRSVKVSIEATSSSDTYRRAMLEITKAPLIPLADNSLYGRFMIWTDRIPDKSVHWTIAHGDGPVGSTGVYATYNYGGMGGLMANYYKDSKPDPTDCWQSIKQDLPTSKWSCVAFHYDGKSSEMRFWLDGTELPDLHVVGMSKTDMTCTVKGVDGKWYAPDFKTISVGWESYQHDAAGAHAAWIDDVILDSKPIPCP